MKTACIFALIFVVAGGVVFSLLAPLIFRGADFERLGKAVAPLILIIPGSLGFLYGYRRHVRKEAKDKPPPIDETL
jgi:hypothetical protein